MHHELPLWILKMIRFIVKDELNLFQSLVPFGTKQIQNISNYFYWSAMMGRRALEWG